MKFHNKMMFLLRIEVVIMFIAIYSYISGIINLIQLIFTLICLVIGAVWLFEAEKYQT
ncbi:MAG: hypothetical protein QG646_722 [Euryarchaeota archaeon]|nr:hypothetical protein [Euryarchaeota archaeon]